jgi:hypothetical protein
MNITVKLPNEVFPHDPLAVADRLEARAMQTDDPDETARLMRLVNKLRTSSNFRTEQSEDLDQVVLEESGAITPSTPEDDPWTTMPVHLEYDLGGGRQIGLGSYNLSARDLRVAVTIGEKSESEFRRLLAELDAAERADGKQDDQVYDAPVSPLSSTTTSLGHGE